MYPTGRNRVKKIQRFFLVQRFRLYPAVTLEGEYKGVVGIVELFNSYPKDYAT